MLMMIREARKNFKWLFSHLNDLLWRRLYLSEGFFASPFGFPSVEGAPLVCYLIIQVVINNGSGYCYRVIIVLGVGPN
jgi:hypothetical protein